MRGFGAFQGENEDRRQRVFGSGRRRRRLRGVLVGAGGVCELLLSDIIAIKIG